jgi:galactokinase
MSWQNGLEHIYGEMAEAQQDRYSAALAAFDRVYGPGLVHVFRAPGRVNLIGEHTDYNHGFVLPLALDRDVLLLARPRCDRLVRLHNVEPGFAPQSFAIDPAIPPAPRGDWSNYVRGAAQMVAHQAGSPVRGMDALVVGAPPYGTPRGAGLSSSSALTVAAAIALAHLNGWHPEPTTFARMCSEAEWYVGTRGGIMDQFAALLARPGHALFLDCRPQGPDRYTFAHVPLPSDHHILIADTGVHRANVRGEFNGRVAACRAGIACLRDRYPGTTHLRDVQHVPWAELEPLLPEALTVAEARALGADLDDVPLPADGAPGSPALRVRACCRHVHSENERVRATVAALETGDVATVGRLLNEAHASARDDYDVSCPELEALIEAARGVKGTVGARLTGAGWGGCIVALVRQEAVADFEAQVPRRYREQSGREATVFACRAGGGAGKIPIPKAQIPTS